MKRGRRGSTHPVGLDPVLVPPASPATASGPMRPAPLTDAIPSPVAPSSDDGDEVLGPQSAPKSWCNPRESMPRQRTSHAAYAAGQLMVRLTSVPPVAGMERESRMHNRGASGGPALMRVAVVPQTALGQDMHAACNRLTVLEAESHLPRLERAESAELQAAALGVPSPDGALPARSASIAVLVNTTTTPNAHALLDAVAHLARAPSATDPPERATHTVRFALLAQGAAHKYALHRAGDALCTRSGFARGSTEVCLTWAEPVPASEATDEGEWRMRSEFAELAYCDSEDAYARELLVTIFKLWADSGFVPARSRLFASYEHSGSSKAAYVKGMVECADDFWNRLRVTGPVRLSPYAERDDEYGGFLEFTDQFVKISPKSLGANLGDPSVFPGLLLHQKGWMEQSREFCDVVREEEYAKAAAHEHRIAAFSLRRPASSAEEAICLHLLLFQSDRVRLGQSLSPYGLLGVPGKPLSSNGKEGNALPRILRRIVPLDDEILSDHFVLPVEYDLCSPMYKGQRQDPLWLAAAESVLEFAPYFEGHDEQGNPLVPQHSLEALEKACRPAPPTPGRSPSEAEADANVLMGMPLGCPAIRLGDAYNEVRKQCGPTSVVAGLLLAASGALGTECSVVDGLAHATDVLVSHKDRTDRDRVTIQTLTRQLEDSTANAGVRGGDDDDGDDACAAPVKEKRHKRDESGANETKAQIPSIDLYVLQRLWRGLGCAPKVNGYEQLPQGAIGSKAVKLVVRMFELSYGVEVNSLWNSTRKWGLQRFKTPVPERGDLQVIGELVGHAIAQTNSAMRMLLAWVEPDDAVWLYEFTRDAVPRCVDVGAVLADPRFETTVFWVWQAEQREIFEYVKTDVEDDDEGHAEGSVSE